MKLFTNFGRIKIQICWKVRGNYVSGKFFDFIVLFPWALSCKINLKVFQTFVKQACPKKFLLFTFDNN